MRNEEYGDFLVSLETMLNKFDEFIDFQVEISDMLRETFLNYGEMLMTEKKTHEE